MNHLVLLLLFQVSTFGEGPIHLVQDGRSDYVIYFEASRKAELEFAAAELRRVIDRSTNVKLPVVHQPSARMISLGENAAAARAGLSLKQLSHEGFVLATKRQSVFILGKDTPIGKRAAGGGFTEGTLQGVYRFLEMTVGARWLMPGDAGEDIPQRRMLSVSPGTLIEQPDFDFRVLQYVHNRNSAVKLWFRRQGLGGWWRSAHGHAWDDFPGKEVVEAHPEFWPMISGKRKMPDYSRYFNGKFCTTNQEFVKAFANAACQRLKAHPEFRVVSVSPSDGGGWCQCATCSRYVDQGPSAKWGDYGGYGCSRTPLLLKFYNDVAREVAKQQPGKFVGGIVYASYTYPPEEPVKLEPNVFLILAPRPYYGLTLYREKYRREFPRLIKAWTDIAPHFGYSDYATWIRTYLGTPLSPARSILKLIFPTLKIYGARGVYLCGLQAWGYGAIHNYLVARLMWDAGADVDALYYEWLERAYGKGAPAMDELYELLDREMAAYERNQKGFGYDLTTDMALKVYAKNYWRIEQLYAEALGAELAEKQKKRLELFGMNLRILFHVLKEAGAIERPRQSIFFPLDGNYERFRKVIADSIAISTPPKRNVGYIERLFIPERRKLSIRNLPEGTPTPDIDGKLNDSAWKNAALANQFQRVAPRKPAEHKTEVRVFYDEANIYFAFTCEDAGKEAILAHTNARDNDSIYTDDCIEIFLSDATRSSRRFWHFTLNPANAQWDARVNNRNANTEWQSATTRNAQGWTAEIRIPFKAFNRLQSPAGQIWRLNLTREDKPSGENSTWTNVEQHFLEPENFGYLEFRK